MTAWGQEVLAKHKDSLDAIYRWFASSDQSDLAMAADGSANLDSLNVRSRTIHPT